MPVNLPLVHIPQVPDGATRALFGCEKIQRLLSSGHGVSLRTILTRGVHAPDLQLTISREDMTLVLEFQGAHPFMSLMGWAQDTGNIPNRLYRQIEGLDARPVEVNEVMEICMCLDLLRLTSGSSEDRQRFDKAVKEEAARGKMEEPTAPARFGRLIDID